MQKRWAQVPNVTVDVAKSLEKELGVSPIIAELLVRRGITSFDSAKHFFRPQLSDLHDPFLMQDMDRAVQRIKRAIAEQEKILVYGDYDVDGTTAVAVTYSFFSKLHDKLDFYLPDRYKEGYGISKAGVDFAADHGFTLVIALDCGIKSVNEIAYARQRGVDFIVCDHHNPGDTLPLADAVLDPKRSDCPYPYKELSGCGIGFKLIQAYARSSGMDPAVCYDYLDLVAVSIASDIVPITGENRILAHFGLQKLNTNPSTGLRALIELAQRGTALNVTDVVFQIGPRINAAGRINHARDAVRLLLATSLEEAQAFGDNVDRQNTERKDVDLKITEEALAMLDGDEILQRRKTTVLFKHDWHKGVIGIVASRLTEKYYRPTVVLTQSNGRVAGSARSVSDFDLYEALCECSDLLEQFGGHKFAAGLTMDAANIPLFQQRFEEVVSSRILPEMLQQEIRIDRELELGDIDRRFFRVLRQFEPFGPGNEAPVFMSRGVTVYGQAYVVGAKHLKMTVTQGNSAAFDCIGFGLGGEAERINRGAPVDICYTIEENVWRDRKSIQLKLKGVRDTVPADHVNTFNTQ